MDQAVLQPPALRPFESAPGALDVDFEAEPAPQLVTAILAACSPDEVDEEGLWALPVGRRIERLLAILAFDGERALWAGLRCANEACGEPIEVDLSPGELVSLARERDDAPVSVAAGGGTLRVRKPTGLDQLAWQGREFRDERDALRSLASELVVGRSGVELDDLVVAKVDEALADHDPLVCFELSVVCPYCRGERSYELDLPELALARFRERQAGLVEDVHALASRYHWTEAEIVAVPAARRARYLALLDRGSD